MKPANPQAKRLHVRLVTLMLGLITAFFLSLSLVTWYMGTERDLRDTNDKITRVGRELKGVLDAELVHEAVAAPDLQRLVGAAVAEVGEQGLGHRRQQRHMVAGNGAATGVGVGGVITGGGATVGTRATAKLAVGWAPSETFSMPRANSRRMSSRVRTPPP